MATKSTKPVTRETTAFIRDRGLRPVIVTIHNGIIELRAKGLRRTEVMDLAGVYVLAVKARVASERAAKIASKRKG